MPLLDLVINWTVLLSAYWLSYFWFRKGKFNSKKLALFFINTSIFIIIIHFFYSSYRNFGILNGITSFAILFMGVIGVVHHFTTLLKRLGKQTEASEFIHESVSHYLFFILLGVNTIYFGINIFGNAKFGIEKFLLSALIITTLTVSVLGCFERTRNWFFKVA